MTNEDSTLTAAGPATEQAKPEAEKPAESAPEAKAAPADVEAAMKAFGERFAGKPEPRKKPEDAKPKEPDEKPIGNEPEKKTESEPAKPEVEKPKRTKSKPSPPLDETRLAEIAAEAGARASTETIARLEREKPKSDPVPPKAEEFKPPKEYAGKYEQFRHLAKTQPERYGTLPDDFKKFVTEEDQYIKNWKREHPGERWDSENEDHNSFYESVTPKYEESDLRRAEVELIVGESEKKTREKLMEELKPRLNELDEMKRAEVVRNLAPIVNTAEKEAMGAILKAIDPTYDKFAEPAELAKLRDEDPVAFDIALEVGKEAIPFAAEVTKLWKSKGAIQAQADNPLHQYIFGYAQQMSNLIKALPRDEQERDGKLFATWTEFAAMQPAQQVRHWTLSDRDLIDRKTLDAQEIAKERIAAETKKLEAWSKRKGLAPASVNNSAQKNGELQPAKPLPSPAVSRETTPSPSVGSKTQVSPNAQPAPSTEPSWAVKFAEIARGRSL